MSYPDGSLEVTLEDGLPADIGIKDYKIFISTEYGREIHLYVTAGQGHVTLRHHDNGTNAAVLKIGQDELLLVPGNYLIRALVDNAEVCRKFFTVVNHPVYPWARTPAPNWEHHHWAGVGSSWYPPPVELT